MMSKTASLFEADATWGRLLYLVKYAHWPQTMLALWETSKKCPKFRCTSPFIGMRMMHLRWNAPHKHGGKQSGDVDWSIITKPHPSSTQEAWLQLWSICNVMSYLTILVLESLPNVTPQHCPQSLINLMGSLNEEAQSEEASEHKSPWQRRRPCKRTTYIAIYGSETSRKKRNYLR